MRIDVLLRRAQPGTRCSVAQHIRRANRLQALIAERFGIHEPYQYQAKHLRYALEHGTAGLAAVTRYDYWRTTRVIAAVLGKWPDWEPSSAIVRASTPPNFPNSLHWSEATQWTSACPE